MTQCFGDLTWRPTSSIFILFGYCIYDLGWQTVRHIFQCHVYGGSLSTGRHNLPKKGWINLPKASQLGLPKISKNGEHNCGRKNNSFFKIDKSCNNEQILGDLRFHQMISARLKHCTWLDMLDFEQPRVGDFPMQIATYAELVPLWLYRFECVLSRTSSLCRCRVPEFSGSRQDLLQLHIWWSIGWWLQNGMVADLLKKAKMVLLWFLECFWSQIIEIHARILPQTASWCLVMLPIPPRKKWCALWPFGPFVYNKWERRQSPTS